MTGSMASRRLHRRTSCTRWTRRRGSCATRVTLGRPRASPDRGSRSRATRSPPSAATRRVRRRQSARERRCDFFTMPRRVKVMMPSERTASSTISSTCAPVDGFGIASSRPSTPPSSSRAHSQRHSISIGTTRSRRRFARPRMHSTVAPTGCGRWTMARWFPSVGIRTRVFSDTDGAGTPKPCSSIFSDSARRVIRFRARRTGVGAMVTSGNRSMDTTSCMPGRSSSISRAIAGWISAGFATHTCASVASIISRTVAGPRTCSGTGGWAGARWPRRRRPWTGSSARPRPSG